MAPDSNNSKSFRRWLRFSVRTLIVLMTLFGIALGYWGRAVQRQKRAMAAIQKHGGIVGYDVNSDSYYACKLRFKVWIRDKADALFGIDIYKVIGFDLFCNAYFIYWHSDNGPANADLILSHCGDLPHLQSIDLRYTFVSDAGLAHLRSNRNLERLSLEGCSNVTDASVPLLSEMASLRHLNLKGTRVTNLSIPLLAKMQHLTYLEFKRSQMWEIDQKKLKEALPDTLVSFGY